MRLPNGGKQFKRGGAEFIRANPWTRCWNSATFNAPAVHQARQVLLAQFSRKARPVIASAIVSSHGIPGLRSAVFSTLRPQKKIQTRTENVGRDEALKYAFRKDS